jgi:hypothetical protein
VPAVFWDPGALAALYWLEAPHAAQTVKDTVMRFAERGEGQLTRVSPYYRLRVEPLGSAGPWDAVLAIDRAARQLTVLRVYLRHAK